MKRLLLLVLVAAIELAGCYAQVGGCGCRRPYDGGPRAGCGCGCG